MQRGTKRLRWKKIISRAAFHRCDWIIHRLVYTHFECLKGYRFLRNCVDTREYGFEMSITNLGWSRTQAKFCQLIASLSVILLQLKLTKLKLEVRKSDFQRKKERYELRYSSSSFRARSCPWGLRGQQLKIELLHITVRHHFQYFAWLKPQAVLSKILNAVCPSCSWSSHRPFHTDIIFAINWQNFAQVRLQLKFALIIRL